MARSETLGVCQEIDRVGSEKPSGGSAWCVEGDEAGAIVSLYNSSVLMVWSHVEKRRILPNVFVISRNEKTPSRRQPQKAHGFWALRLEMLDMKGHEKIGIMGWFAACPDVPTGRISNGRMP